MRVVPNECDREGVAFHDERTMNIRHPTYLARYIIVTMLVFVNFQENKALRLIFFVLALDEEVNEAP
jgi:hypothetical protein